jgi:hypothetical protein
VIGFLDWTPFPFHLPALQEIDMLIDAMWFAFLTMVAGAVFTVVCWFTILAINALNNDSDGGKS